MNHRSEAAEFRWETSSAGAKLMIVLICLAGLLLAGVVLGVRFLGKLLPLVAIVAIAYIAYIKGVIHF